MNWFMIYLMIGLVVGVYFIYIDRKEHKIYNWDSVFIGGLFIWPIQILDAFPLWMESRKKREFTFTDGFKTEQEAYPERFI